MEKINFENLPSTNTPINADNLNQMQDNVENEITETQTYLENAISEIIESGSNSNGSYIKYADGTMICTKKISYTNVAITTAWGSFYESLRLDIGNYAQEFIEVPTISVMPTNPIFVEKMGDATTTSFGSFYATKPKSDTVSCSIDCIAIGKWK